MALPADEVLGYRRQFVAAHRRAHTRPMWLAAAVLHSDPDSEPEFGDDSFTDFRSWLISRSHTAFTRAVDDPDTALVTGSLIGIPVRHDPHRW